MQDLDAYMPMDRRHALATGRHLPDRTYGAALFADISGFTPLTEALVQEFGPRRGADELTRQLNLVYDALITQVHSFRGSVITFSGDAITCWFDLDDGLKATACALAMQQAMLQFDRVETPSGLVVSLSMKAAVATGPVRRFLVGDPAIQLLDVLAGATLDRMAEGEHLAQRGEVVLAPSAVAQLGGRALIREWRENDDGDRFGVISGLLAEVPPDPWPELSDEEMVKVTEEKQRAWLLPPVYERLMTSSGRFLADLRLGVALFLRFSGPDYDRDPEAGEKLDRYLRWVQSVLARYEGYMFQLTLGDKGCYLYGAFGAPLAHDDDPARAAAAAIELHAPPVEGCCEGGVQIGISQGRLRAGAYGGTMRRTYGVLGDEVNIAARLMGIAEPGQTLVSDHVARAIAESCQLEAVGRVQVKGKQEPIPVSVLLGRRLSTALSPMGTFRNPLVGREGELEQMMQCLEQAVDGQGQILRLEGEAGLGKSHLAAEFVTRAADRGFRVAAGICQSTGQAVPYYPWRQAFRGLLGLSDEPAGSEEQIAWAGEQIARVEAWVEKTNREWFPRLALLGDLLGLPIPDTATTAAFDPQVRQQALIALVVEIVQAWSGTRPLLLLLEDMRWADDASLELALALGRNIDRSAVLLVIVHRPAIREDLALLPGFQALAYHHHLDLSELSPEGVAALIGDRLQGEPSRLALSLIQAQAQGNPFFTEELVDTLRESGTLYPNAEGRWVLTDDVFEALREANCLTCSDDQDEWTLSADAHLAAVDLGIPESIDGVVLSRLDRLPETHKLSLKVASVIGRVFEFDLLARSHPVHPSGENLHDQVKEMEARDFTRLELPTPQLVYMFKHNITQEVVYGTLLDDQQRELHRAIAESLEALLPEAVERLGHHYYEGQVWPKALTYNLEIADRAQRGFANDIAVSTYQKALLAAKKTDEDTRDRQLLAHEALGEVLTRIGDYEQALKHYASARELVPEFNSKHMASVCRKTAEVYERRSEYDAALEWLEKGLGGLDAEGPTIEAARIYVLRAGIHIRQGDYERAIEWCQESLERAQEIETREGQQVLAQADYLMGFAYLRRGDAHRAVQSCQKSIDGYQQIDDIFGQSKAYNNLASAYKSLGEWDEASDAYEESLAINREIGDVQQQGFVTNNLGNVYLLRGEWEQAADHFEQSSSIWRQLGAQLFEGVTLSNLAQVHIYEGVWQEAFTCLTSSERIFQETGSDHFVPELERRWGEYYLRTGDLDSALGHLYHSIEMAMAQEARAEEGMSLRVLGDVHREYGNHALAQATLRQGLSLLEGLNSEYEVAKTRLSLARVEADADPAGAQMLLKQAAQTFERLGAKADLMESQLLAR